MGIIGIVSALTLPNLNSSTGDKERVAKAKKIYQNIEDAFGRAEAVYGPYEEWFINDGNDQTKIATRKAQRITEFMKLQKDCGMGTGGGCFPAGGDVEDSISYKVLTADGTSVAFDGDVGSQDIYFIDLDGPNKGGSVYGKDLFKGPIVYNSQTKQLELMNVNDPAAAAKGDLDSGITWMVLFDNADYLKTKNDNSGKCKNNESIILDGVSHVSCK